MRNRSIFFRSTTVVLLFIICACQKEPEQLSQIPGDSILKPFAGTTIGYKDGPVLEAKFQFPILIAAGPDKTLFVVENTYLWSNYALEGGSRIRKISPSGIVSTFYDLKTTVLAENTIRGIAVDKNGVVFISEGDQIKKISTDGSQATVVAGDGTTATMKDGPALSASFWEPTGLAFDKNGCLYIMDTRNNAVRLFTGGKVSTLAGGNRDFNAESPLNFEGPKDGTGRQAEFDFPKFLTLDEQRNVYVVGGLFALIRKITPAGVVSTILRKTFTFDSDNLDTFRGITGPHEGQLYFNGIFHDFAGVNFLFFVQSFNLTDNLQTTLLSDNYDVDENDNGQSYPSPMEHGLNVPNGMVIVDNTLYICNTGEGRIRKVDLN